MHRIGSIDVAVQLTHFSIQHCVYLQMEGLEFIDESAIFFNFFL